MIEMPTSTIRPKQNGYCTLLTEKEIDTFRSVTREITEYKTQDYSPPIGKKINNLIGEPILLTERISKSNSTNQMRISYRKKRKHKMKIPRLKIIEERAEKLISNIRHNMGRNDSKTSYLVTKTVYNNNSFTLP
jgi:hypothetical protein